MHGTYIDNFYLFYDTLQAKQVGSCSDASELYWEHPVSNTDQDSFLTVFLSFQQILAWYL